MALAALLVLYRRRFSDMVDLTDVGDIYSRGVVDVDVGDITGGAVGCVDPARRLASGAEAVSPEIWQLWWMTQASPPPFPG